jgi:2-C-methyl-D-erythritol 4-phosphate cytidylyltransferase
MNTALIFAGGAGIRMNALARPKQFLELHGKPVIVYTLEHFERHEMIDNIVVVCLESWIRECGILLKRHNIGKVSQIIAGGDTGQNSIYNGLKSLETVCGDDDIVLIHDGVRPLITEELITANIKKVRESGTAITAEPMTESVVESLDGETITRVPNRDCMYAAKAPQSFYYGMIRDVYEKARRENVSAIDSAHLLFVFGYGMHTVKSTPNNMKITTPTDYYIFRALYEAMENSQIFGL